MMRYLFALLLVACSADDVFNSAIRWERWRAGMTLHDPVNVNGQMIPYLEGGEGEPVLLVHGFGADKDTWMFLARLLNKDHRVISLDLPGFGEATRDNSERYGVPEQAQRLDVFMEKVGIQKAHIIGSSMGGAISAGLALDYPHRVRTLTLIDAMGVESPEKSDISKEFEQGRNPLVLRSEKDFDQMLAFNFVKTPDLPEFAKRLFVKRAIANAAFSDKVFNDLNNPPLKLQARLGEIKIPTLIIWGDSDRIIHPSSANVFAQGIAGSQVKVIAACGHSPHMERPEEVTKLWSEFLKH